MIGITRGILLALALLLVYLIYVANRRHKFPHLGGEE
jgi:hypothetical protein